MKAKTIMLMGAIAVVPLFVAIKAYASSCVGEKSAVGCGGDYYLHIEYVEVDGHPYLVGTCDAQETTENVRDCDWGASSGTYSCWPNDITCEYETYFSNCEGIETPEPREHEVDITEYFPGGVACSS